MPIPAGWDQFVQEYSADRRFQFFPHASSIGTDRWPDAVRILGSFEGQTWDDSLVMAALRNANVTEGKTAIARVIRRAIENLGFCWFDDHVLWITPAGKAFIEGTEPDRTKLMEKLLWRYHLDNPVNDGARGFDLFPHAALIEVLLALPDRRLTRDEFILFFGRCRNHAAVAEIIAIIEEWRGLTLAQQDAVIAAVPKGEFEKRRTDTSYALGFHATASYLERFRDTRGRKGVSIRAGAEGLAGERLSAHGGAAVPIEFENEADFVAFHGDPEADVDPLANVDYLIDTSQWDKAVAAFKAMPPELRGGVSEAEFEEEVFLERHLEEYLLGNLDLIEPGLQLIKRQHRIEIGAIDLYCRSPGNELVIVELKKVRASDKVFGQLCRYIGCIRAKHAAANQTVRGYIIGSAIDEKLRYAAAVAPAGVVQLRFFRRDPVNAAIFIEG